MVLDLNNPDKEDKPLLDPLLEKESKLVELRMLLQFQLTIQEEKVEEEVEDFDPLCIYLRILVYKIKQTLIFK